jgi:hypothetical protein
LEVADSFHRGGPVDPVYTTAIKAESSEMVLYFGDVVAAQVGGDEHEIAITELPRSFHESGPSVRGADSRGF